MQLVKKRESTIDVSIETILESVQKEILERKSQREQAHKTILHLDNNTSESDEAGSCENEATISGSNEKSNSCHESESQAIAKRVIDDILENVCKDKQ